MGTSRILLAVDAKRQRGPVLPVPGRRCGAARLCLPVPPLLSFLALVEGRFGHFAVAGGDILGICGEKGSGRGLGLAPRRSPADPLPPASPPGAFVAIAARPGTAGCSPAPAPAQIPLRAARGHRTPQRRAAGREGALAVPYVARSRLRGCRCRAAETRRPRSQQNVRNGGSRGPLPEPRAPVASRPGAGDPRCSAEMPGRRKNKGCCSHGEKHSREWHLPAAAARPRGARAGGVAGRAVPPSPLGSRRSSEPGGAFRCGPPCPSTGPELRPLLARRHPAEAGRGSTLPAATLREGTAGTVRELREDAR